MRVIGEPGARKGNRCVSYPVKHSILSQYACQAVPDDVDIKVMVEGVLEETGFKEQRAAKMSVDDLLKCDSICRTLLVSNRPRRLLSAFHDVGIHFA